MKIDLENWFETHRKSVVIGTMPVLIVLFWHLVTVISTPLGRAREIGSIPLFREDLAPGNDGLKVVFSRDTEEGVGVFFLDTEAGNKPRLLCEQREKGYSWQRFGMLGWSPNDRFFVCAFPTLKSLNAGQHDEKLIVCSGADGQQLAEIDADPDITEVAWLGPDSFACITYNQNITVYEHKSDANWIKVREFKQAAPGRLESSNSEFKALSSTVVAWCNLNVIWKLDFNNTSADKVFEATNHLVGFTKDLAPILDTTLTKGQSFQPLESYVGSGRYLYQIRNQWGHGPGIWQFDTHSQDTHSVFQAATPRHVLETPRSGLLTNAGGRRVAFHIWSPPEDGRKHPLILAQTPYIWNIYAQIAATEGYCFALVERRYWDDPTINQWSQDVLALYQALSDQPNIDTHHVYLYATSWESTFLSDLVERKPELWCGAILTDPTTLPEWGGSDQLVIAGSAEPGEDPRLRDFEARAYERGIPLRLVLQGGVAHVPRSLAANRERAVQYARFLHEHYIRIH
jgi:hypothetical protein